MDTSRDTLKVDRVEKVLKQYWFTKTSAVDQMSSHLPLGITFLRYGT